MKKIKKTGLVLFKSFSAFCFAYTLVLIGQELLSYGWLSFFFLLLSLMGAFFYLVKGYGFFGVLLVNLSLILIAFLLRWYVIMAYKP